MTETLRVRPRRGLILAGVPREGADLPRELAEGWLADRMVERVPVTSSAPAVRSGSPTPPKAGVKAGPKQRSSR